MIKQYILIVLLLAVGFKAVSQIGLSASPMKLEFSASRGGMQSLDVIVSNSGEEQVQVGVSLSDWKRDSMGVIHYYPVGSLKSSCSQWLKILPNANFVLQPLEKKKVSVMLKAADSAVTKSLNAMLFFTQLNPMKAARQKNGLNILLNVKLGVQIFYTPPGVSKKEVEIAGFNDTLLVHKDSTKESALLLTLVNNGVVETDGKVNFELNNLQTGEKITLPEDKFYTLPGAVFKVVQVLPAGLKKGNYSATALIDYGEDYELKIAELEFKQD
ncbi:fimbrial biogenesis chaperone [Arachidicoccus terrestris]|uniref:hypothetical protein n=1 Tax=Arachidicoccus terrestris TaxID=2875539 RepID=UPI001CC6F479|nr:hypothetical protein [Arachidicoccus terrestris]UAY55389.1 hypothetical protein K9M52_18610 [Arachidicoccus terrestris]